MTAARLQHMGIRALVIEKTPRVGDVWRNRYVAALSQRWLTTNLIQGIITSRCIHPLMLIRVSASRRVAIFMLTPRCLVLYESFP